MITLKQINWWRVAAYCLLALSVGGLLTALLLDAEALNWGLASLISYGIVRLEWFLSTLTEAKNTDGTYDQDYTV